MDNRGRAEQVAMQIALQHEQMRGALVIDVSAGRQAELPDALRELGCVDLPSPPSADLLSRLADELRVIEVKGRGTKGPITVLERQLDTFRTAQGASWLYVVWNCTQPSGQELWLIQAPARLPWVETRAASRPKGGPRGTSHEAQYEIEWEEVETHGVRASLRN